MARGDDLDSTYQPYRKTNRKDGYYVKQVTVKRTLVERVAQYLFNEAVMVCKLTEQSHAVERAWKREARRIIAMVRRHDKGGKK